MEILLALAITFSQPKEGLQIEYPLEIDIPVKKVPDFHTEVVVPLIAAQEAKRIEDERIAAEAHRAAVEAERVRQAQIAAAVPKVVYTPPKVAQATGSCRDWIVQAGVSEVEAAYTLIMKESGCRVNAYNPSGAGGIPQSLPASKMASAGADWQTNPVTQIRWMKSYVEARYGSFAAALAHSNRVNWY